MDKNEFMFGLETDEEKQSYLDDVEREARHVIERDEMMKENFAKYFSSYFPRYLASNGPAEVLSMIDIEDIKAYVKDLTIREIEQRQAELEDAERNLTVKDSDRIMRDFLFGCLSKISSAADDVELSDSEFRSFAQEVYYEAVDRDCEMSVLEDDAEMAEAEKAYLEEMEDERLYIQEEAEAVYRSSQL